MERDLEDLRARMRRALEDPKKVAEIAVAALRSPYNAYRVVMESTEDKQLAQDWRNTLMLRRDQEKYGISFPEELASVFSEQNQNAKQEEKEMGEKKMIEDAVFELPGSTRILTEELASTPGSRKVSLKFNTATIETFSLRLLDAVKDFVWHPKAEAELGAMMIWILEERFGLKVRICWNCKYYLGMCQIPSAVGFSPGVRCSRQDFCPRLETALEGCKHWSPKEVSEKPAVPPRKVDPLLGETITSL